MSRAPSSSQNLQNSQAHSCFWLLALTWMKAPYSPVFQSWSSTVGIGAAETRKSCGYSSWSLRKRRLYGAVNEEVKSAAEKLFCWYASTWRASAWDHGYSTPSRISSAEVSRCSRNAGWEKFESPSAVRR